MVMVGSTASTGRRPHDFRFVMACRTPAVTRSLMMACSSSAIEVLEGNVLHPDVTDTVVRKAVSKFRASQNEKKNR